MMRVRKVQEVEVPGLSKQLLSARKASEMSLLEICRQLDITPTYWYKLEKGGAETINYDLLEKIEDLLLLNLGIEFPSDLNIDSKHKENGMNLSRLKWIKVVTPDDGYRHHWAYSMPELTDVTLHIKSFDRIIQQNELTIFPLGFKQRKGSDEPALGDLVALTQRGKITHVVEFLDDQPYERGGWFHRYVKIVWWKPEMDWKVFPPRENVLGFKFFNQQSRPFEISNLDRFKTFWDEKGGLEAFREYFANELSKIGQLQPQ